VALNSFAVAQPRARVVLRAFTSALFISVVNLAGLAPASAQEGAATAASGLREDALKSWKRGDYEGAEKKYRTLIERGGLRPKDVVDAYVHLGASRAMLGKKPEAIKAFRAAGILDFEFKVPPEATERVIQLAEGARKDVAAIGPIDFRAELPEKIKAGEPINVLVTLDEAHIPIGTKIAMKVKDTVSGKEYAEDAKVGPTVPLEIPGSFVLANSNLKLQVSVLDRFENRVAMVEKTYSMASGGAALPDKPADKVEKDPKENKEEKKSSGGFFSTPWPWLIGGILLAGAATVSYFLWLKPPSTVRFGAPTVSAGE
jgi:hypothetical protein